MSEAVQRQQTAENEEGRKDQSVVSTDVNNISDDTPLPGVMTFDDIVSYFRELPGTRAEVKALDGDRNGLSLRPIAGSELAEALLAAEIAPSSWPLYQRSQPTARKELWTIKHSEFDSSGHPQLVTWLSVDGEVIVTTPAFNVQSWQPGSTVIASEDIKEMHSRYEQD